MATKKKNRIYYLMNYETIILYVEDRCVNDMLLKFIKNKMDFIFSSLLFNYYVEIGMEKQCSMVNHKLCLPISSGKIKRKK